MAVKHLWFKQHLFLVKDMVVQADKIKATQELKMIIPNPTTFRAVYQITERQSEATLQTEAQLQLWPKNKRNSNS